MKPVHYKRARFSTYLPTDRLYTPSHFWLLQRADGEWQVGFTKLATRMLGEVVECQFEANPNDEVAVGDVIGSLEAFKAMTDLYCVAEGLFLEKNAEIDHDPSVVSSFPYDQGWLYAVQGTPDEGCVDVHGYVELLNETIDRMQEQEQK